MLSAGRFSNISSRSETVLPKLHRVREGTDDRYRSQDQVQEQHANHLPRHPLHIHTVDRVHVGQGQRVIEPVLTALHSPGTNAIKLFFVITSVTRLGNFSKEFAKSFPQNSLNIW